MIVPLRNKLLPDDFYYIPRYRSAASEGKMGTTYLGGYRIPAFTVHMGPARLHIGGIGAVVTHPAYRHQGIAGALMRDTIAYATQRHYALLLDGIPNLAIITWFQLDDDRFL